MRKVIIGVAISTCNAARSCKLFNNVPRKLTVYTGSYVPFPTPSPYRALSFANSCADFARVDVVNAAEVAAAGFVLDLSSRVEGFSPYLNRVQCFLLRGITSTSVKLILQSDDGKATKIQMECRRFPIVIPTFRPWRHDPSILMSPVVIGDKDVDLTAAYFIYPRRWSSSHYILSPSHSRPTDLRGIAEYVSLDSSNEPQELELGFEVPMLTETVQSVWVSRHGAVTSTYDDLVALSQGSSPTYTYFLGFWQHGFEYGEVGAVKEKGSATIQWTAPPYSFQLQLFADGSWELVGESCDSWDPARPTGFGAAGRFDELPRPTACPEHVGWRGVLERRSGYEYGGGERVWVNKIDGNVVEEGGLASAPKTAIVEMPTIEQDQMEGELQLLWQGVPVAASRAGGI